MEYKTILNVESSENTYLLFDEETRNGIIIDPGIDIDKIERFIKDNNVNLKYILLTHCHYDHITSLIPLIPGSSLYYTMTNAFLRNGVDFIERGIITLSLAGTLAAGIIVVAGLAKIFKRAKNGTR